MFYALVLVSHGGSPSANRQTNIEAFGRKNHGWMFRQHTKRRHNSILISDVRIKKKVNQISYTWAYKIKIHIQKMAEMKNVQGILRQISGDTVHWVDGDKINFLSFWTKNVPCDEASMNGWMHSFRSNIYVLIETISLFFVEIDGNELIFSVLFRIMSTEHR